MKLHDGCHALVQHCSTSTFFPSVLDGAVGKKIDPVVQVIGECYIYWANNF